MAKKQSALPRKTMLSFILWYNDIEIAWLARDTKLSYVTLHQLCSGKQRNFSQRTLQDVATSIGQPVDVWYDIEKKDHKYYGDDEN